MVFASDYLHFVEKACKTAQPANAKSGTHGASGPVSQWAEMPDSNLSAVAVLPQQDVEAVAEAFSRVLRRRYVGMDFVATVGPRKGSDAVKPSTPPREVVRKKATRDHVNPRRQRQMPALA
jgi:hypothetical protein